MRTFVDIDTDICVVDICLVATLANAVKAAFRVVAHSVDMAVVRIKNAFVDVGTICSVSVVSRVACTQIAADSVNAGGIDIAIVVGVVGAFVNVLAQILVRVVGR